MFFGLSWIAIVAIVAIIATAVAQIGNVIRQDRAWQESRKAKEEKSKSEPPQSGRRKR